MFERLKGAFWSDRSFYADLPSTSFVINCTFGFLGVILIATVIGVVISHQQQTDFHFEPSLWAIAILGVFAGAFIPVAVAVDFDRQAKKQAPKIEQDAIKRDGLFLGQLKQQNAVLEKILAALEKANGRPSS